MLLEALLNVGVQREFTLPDMLEWGRALGARLPARVVVTLQGDLGAGKTTLVRALCEGAGVFDAHVVTSPTFAIMHEYESARGPIVHADLYRLKGDGDLDALGWDEIVASANLLVVEWPERVTRGWPAGTIAIALMYPASVGATRRVSVVTL